MKKKILCIVFLLIYMLCMGFSVSAVESDEIPFETYTYWVDGNDKKAVGIKPLYRFSKMFDGDDWNIGALNAPNDIVTDKNGLVYLLDSGNSRIIILNPDGTYNGIVSNLEFNGEQLDFTGAKGISIDRRGGLMIADSNNARVIRLDKDYKVKSFVSLPDSSVIPDDFVFQPTKAVEDKEGYLYVLSYGSYYGALVYSPENVFCGFYGSNEVQGNILTALGTIWKKITYTEQKQSASTQKIPYQFVNMALDENNFLYTITGRTDAWSVTKGQIRKMNPSGKNVLKTYNGKNASSFDFGDISNLRIDKTSQKVETNFVSICLDEKGFIYALDSNFGHIFIYDKNSNPLCVFGDNTGEQYGTFEYAQAVAAHGEYVYVIDSIRNNLTVFTETDYCKLYKQAQLLTLQENYEEAFPLWQNILRQDKNNQLAYRALAHFMLEEQRFKDAMHYSEIGIDRTTYALAFRQVRTKFIANNAQWLILGAAFAVVTISIIFYIIKRKKDAQPKAKSQFAFSLSVIMHPFNRFAMIKNRSMGSVWIAAVYLIVLFLSRCTEDLLIGFSFGSVDKAEYNALITFAGSALIAVLFAVSNWLICVLMDGKGKLREIFIVTCYSMLPLIVKNFLGAILSNILVPDEAILLTLLNIVAWAIAGIMLCIGIMIVQEYDFFHFLGTAVLTVLAMGLVIFIIFMIGILIQECSGFLQSVYHEIFFR